MLTGTTGTTPSLKTTDSLLIAISSSWYTEERGQRCPGCLYLAVSWRRSDRHFLTHITTILDFSPRRSVTRCCAMNWYICWTIVMFQSRVMSSTEDDFSPSLELETGLRRTDSNRSWTGSQEKEEAEVEDKINMNTLFMISLTTIVSLFT